MALLRPTPWTQQPQSAVEIDWSNPITQGLVLSFSPASQNAPLPFQRSAVGKHGCMSSQGGIASTDPRLSTAAFTAFLVFRTTETIAAQQCVIGRGTSSQATNNTGFGLHASHASSDYSGAFYAGNGYTIVGKPTGGALAPNTDYIIALSVDAAGVGRCYNAGVQTASASVSGIDLTPRLAINANSALDASDNALFQFALVKYWNRALSDAEIKSISANHWQIFKPIPRRIFVPVGGEAGPQDLYPNLYTNDQTFYTHTLSQSGGTQTLTPSLYTNDQTFYTHTLSATKTLTPSLYTNSQGFYDPTLSATKALTATLHTNSSAFYGPSISVGTVTLTPGLYTNDQTFYAPVVQLDGGPQYIAPDLYTGSQTFYGATVQPGAVAITPSLYSNDQTSFYSLTVTTTKTLTATLFTNDQTFYAPIVSLAGGTQYVVPSLHTNVESFFSATVSTGAVQLYPALYTNTQTFYNATLGGALTDSEKLDLIISMLAAQPSAAEIAAAILAAAQVTPMHTDMRKTNGQTIIGDGTDGNKFRSHLVG